MNDANTMVKKTGISDMMFVGMGMFWISQLVIAYVTSKFEEDLREATIGSDDLNVIINSMGKAIKSLGHALDFGLPALIGTFVGGTLCTTSAFVHGLKDKDSRICVIAVSVLTLAATATKHLPYVCTVFPILWLMLIARTWPKKKEN